MSYNDLREKQIYEILNQDRFINQKVVELNKKAVERYNSDLAPVPANDKEVIGGIDTLIEKLNGILYNKVSLLESVPENIDRFNDLYDYKGIISTFIEINKVDDILSLYNSIVKQYLAPSTMTNVSKTVIRSKLSGILTNLTNVYEKIERIIIIYVKQYNNFPPLQETDPGGQGGTKLLKFLNIGRVISRCLSTFSIFRIMKEQIEADKYHIIDISEFDSEVKRLSDKNPEIKKFLEKVKDLDPRLHRDKYLTAYARTPEYNRKLEGVIRGFARRYGRPPNDEEQRRIENAIKAKFSESFSKDKLKAENAYEAELGREMTPNERRHFLNMNQAAEPENVIQIIQPPPYFDIEERVRENQRVERMRQYNADLARQGRERARERRIEEGQPVRDERERRRQEADGEEPYNIFDDFFF